MASAEFRPGFRLSVLDALFLCLGAAGAYWVWSREQWLGFIIAFVVGHFFLFCNVFRIARNLELLWGAGYVLITLFTLRFYASEWTPITLLPLFLTALVIWIELHKPSYHGVGWRRINPGLRERWKANHQ